MTFYLLFIFLVTLLTLLTYLYPEKSKIFQIGLLVLVVSVSGFRDNLSGDFRAYVSWYENKTRDFDFEFGFVWIMNLFRWLHCSYHVIFFFFSFFTVLFVFLGVKKHTVHSNLAFLFFLLIPVLYLNSWSIIRQAFAMSIAFYAFHFLIEKKHSVFIILMSVGIAIHFTAIIPFLAFLFVCKYADKIKTVHLVLMLFFSLIMSQIHWLYFFSGFFERTRYIYYFSYSVASVSMLKMIVLNGLAIFLLFYFQKMKSAYPNQKYFMVLYFLSVFVTNLFASINDLTRIAYFFTLFEIVVFADLVFLEFKNRRIFLVAGLYVYCLSFFLYTLRVDYFLNNQDTKYLPYNSIFYKFDDPFFMMGTDYLIDKSLGKEEK